MSDRTRPAASTFCLAVAAALPAVLTGSGCTGVEPALLGAALTGAQTGVTLLSDHEVWIFEVADFDQTCASVDRTGDELHLRRINQVRNDERYYVYFRFGDTSKLIIEVRRETPVVTSIQARVGDADNQGLASLFVKRALENRHAAAAADVVDRPPAPSPPAPTRPSSDRYEP